MRALVRLVCERCWAMNRGELEADGWTTEVAVQQPVEGICSMCGRIEGSPTVRLESVQTPPRRPSGSSRGS